MYSGYQALFPIFQTDEASTAHPGEKWKQILTIDTFLVATYDK